MSNKVEKVEVFNLLNEILDKDMISIKYEENIKFNIKKEIKKTFLENMLSLFLFNGKNILLLCGSYEDIEDISIIKDLGNKVVYLDLDNENFIKKLEYEIKNLKEVTGRTFMNKVYLVNRKLIKDINKVKDINEFFYKKEEVSLVDLYYKSTKKIDKYCYFYKDYSIFRIKNSSINLNFKELARAKNEIIINKSYEKYIKYRRYKDNTKLKILREDINNIDIFIEKIREIIKNDKITISVSNTKYTKEFFNSYIYNPNITNNDIRNIANVINVKYNSNMLREEESNKIKKYIFKKKYQIEKNNKKEEFEKAQEMIEFEIHSIKNMLDIELKKYEFLKEIIIEKSYADLIKSFIQGNDIKDNIEIIYNILIVKNNLKSLEEEIRNYDNGVKSILKYSYENVEDKQDIINFIENIEIFKANYEIEKRELSNVNIENYKLYNYILKDIIEDQIIKENYIKQSIEYVWENKIKEELKVNNGSYINLESNSLDDYLGLFPIQVALKDTVDNKILEKFKTIISIDKTSVTLYKNYFDNSFNIKDSSKLYKDIINLYNFNEDDYYHNVLLNYLYENYKSIEVNFTLDNVNLPLYIKSKDVNHCIIIDCNEGQNYNLYKELYFLSILKEHNINFTRIWIRDLWEDKNKVFKYIIKEIDSYN